jgi:hypothetical protein
MLKFISKPEKEIVSSRSWGIAQKYSTCLAYTRSWIPSPVLQKIKIK